MVPYYPEWQCMLHVEKNTLSPFGKNEIQALLTLKGWRGLLPHALSDDHLLRLADQLRDLFSGRESCDDQGSNDAALPVILVLLSKAGATPEELEDDMELMQGGMTLLTIMTEREIVGRVLQRTGSSDDQGLMHELKEMVRGHRRAVKASAKLNRQSAQRNRFAQPEGGFVQI